MSRVVRFERGEWAIPYPGRLVEVDGAQLIVEKVTPVTDGVYRLFLEEAYPAFYDVALREASDKEIAREAALKLEWNAPPRRRWWEFWQ